LHEKTQVKYYSKTKVFYLRIINQQFKKFLPISEIFHTKKTQVNYYSKTKGFYFRIIIQQFKISSHKFRRSVNKPSEFGLQLGLGMKT